MSDLKFNIGTSNGRTFEANVKTLIVDIFNQNVILVNECYEVDSEGVKLQTEFAKSYERNLIANNSTLVHPETGQYWDSIAEEDRPEGVDPIGEWDFFWFVAQNAPITVVPFIQQTLSKNRERLMPTGFTLDV